MRRTTLGPISSSQLNARPAIRNGGSIGPQNGSRMSIGPMGKVAAPVRQSIGPGSSTTATRRVSTASHAPPRTSTSKHSLGSNGVGGRRSSTYGRSSINGRGSRADPRPLTDKTFMNGCIQALIEFLAEREYGHVLSPKLLKGPSRKDVCNIIHFLFRQIDPTFEFGLKFEEDVTNQFKILRYPFAISKTALVAVGSPHTWPALLGSITWVMELLSYDEVVLQNDSMKEDDGSEDNDEYFFTYLNSAYRVFLSGDDEQYHALEQQEANKYETKNQWIREECTTLEASNEELRQRIQAAKEAKSSLPALEQKKQEALADLEQFRTFVAKLEVNQQQFEDKIKHREDELIAYEAAMQALQHQMQSLEHRIQHQQLKADEAQRIARERIRLQELHAQVETRQKEIQNQMWQQEAVLAEQMDTLENYVQHKYTTLAKEMKLLPMMAKNAHGIDYEIEIDAHTHRGKAAQALSTHIKQVIRPALMTFHRNRKERNQVALDELLQLQQEVEKSRALHEVEYQAEQAMQVRMRKLEESFRREKDAKEAQISQLLEKTEDVELQIENLLNERDLATEEVHTQQMIEQLHKSGATMIESMELLIEKNRHEITNALMSCTEEKERMEQEIASLEEAISSFWL